MFDHMLNQLIRGICTFGRTIRAFVIRRCTGIVSFFRRMTNVSRGAAKAANSAVQSALSASQKPSKREDYIETRRLLISKSLLIRIFLLLVALGLLGYLVVWPFLLSHFFTARFFEQDERVGDWSGKVIVYADREKTIPLYEGRLEDGVLQGQGKAYDEDGNVAYEGGFTNGERDGRGAAYEGGVLVYEGQFSQGVYEGSGVGYQDGMAVYEGQFSQGLYEGSGTSFSNGVVVYEGQFSGGVREGNGTLYQDGVLCYKGQFHDGLYEGQGKRYTNGKLSYEGSFQAGLASGEGAAYRPDGGLRYKGQFAQGVFEGEGTFYASDGSVRYEGGFSAGLYSGEGTLTLREGEKLEAEFQAGKASGVVRWSRGGKPYFEGEWADGLPEGFGVLYGQDGEPLYSGQFYHGSVDGCWLLGLGAQELREALGRVEEGPAVEAGYWISSPQLGLSALCSYQTEEEASRVCAIYLESPEAAWARPLPGEEGVSSDIWPGDAAVTSGKIDFHPQGPVRLAGGRYKSRTARTAEQRVTVLYGRDGEALLAVWWDLAEEAAQREADETEEEEEEEEIPDSVEDFLDALSEMKETGGAQSGGEEAGTEDALTLLSSAGTAEAAKELAGRLMDWWGQAQRLDALESRQERTQILLDEASEAARTGKGSADAVSALEQAQLQTAGDIEQCKLELGKVELALGDVDPADYALDALTASFDPAEAETGDLALITAAYAQATGRDCDAGALEETLQNALVELDQAHARVQNGMEHYQSAMGAAKRAAGAYAMGSGSKAAWYEALSTQEEARAALCEALAEFTRQANELNWTTGGWVSRSFGWCEAVFTPLFEADILPEPVEPPEGEGASEAGPDSAGTAEDGTAGEGSGTAGDAPGSETVEGAPTEDIPADIPEGG